MFRKRSSVLNLIYSGQQLFSYTIKAGARYHEIDQDFLSNYLEDNAPTT